MAEINLTNMAGGFNNGNKTVDKQKRENTTATKVVPSTFAAVHGNKATPVQNLMNMNLEKTIGTLFKFDGVEKQEIKDKDTGEITVNSLYSVKTLSKKAKAKVGTMLIIKVKDSKPLFDDEKLDRMLLESNPKPIIVRFDDLAHYAFIGGESLNASKIEQVSISPMEASKF